MVARFVVLAALIVVAEIGGAAAIATSHVKVLSRYLFRRRGRENSIEFHVSSSGVARNDNRCNLPATVALGSSIGLFCITEKGVSDHGL